MQERLKVRSTQLNVASERMVDPAIAAYKPLPGGDDPRSQRWRSIVEYYDIRRSWSKLVLEHRREPDASLEPVLSGGVLTAVKKHADIDVALCMRASLGEAAEKINRDEAPIRSKARRQRFFNASHFSPDPFVPWPFYADTRHRAPAASATLPPNVPSARRTGSTRTRFPSPGVNGALCPSTEKMVCTRSMKVWGVSSASATRLTRFPWIPPSTLGRLFFDHAIVC